MAIAQTLIQGGTLDFSDGGADHWPGIAMNLAGASLLLVSANLTHLATPAQGLAGITYGGMALTPVSGSLHSTPSNCEHSLWYLINPLAGSNSLKFSDGGHNVGWCLWQAVSFSGTAGVALLGAPDVQGHSSYANNATVTVDVQAATSMLALFSASLYANPGTLATPSGFSLVDTQINPDTISSGDLSSLRYYRADPALTLGEQDVTVSNGCSGTPRGCVLLTIVEVKAGAGPQELLGAPVALDLMPGTGQVSRTPILTGNGAATELRAGQGFVSRRAAFPIVILPGASLALGIGFWPTSIGERSGALTITSNAAGGERVTPLQGKGSLTPTMFLTTSGTQIIDYAGQPIQLKSISWYGANEDTWVPHALWAMNWEHILQTIAGLGFNSLRLPFSGALATNLTAMPRSSPQSIDYSRNADLAGKTAHQILRMILDKCHDLGLRVILDMHQRTETSGVDGDPLGGGTLQQWIDAWLSMANQYKDHLAVIGVDVYNEPWTLTWSQWADYAEACGNQLLEVAPHWLMFIQGVGNEGAEPPDNYWWGGNLVGAKTRPVVLARKGRLVYTTHEYGQSTGTDQSWLKSTTRDVVDYPNSLFAMMREKFGFIRTELIKPLWVGEYGGAIGGFGGHKYVEASVYPNYVYELEWFDVLTRFINGEYYGDGVIHLGPGEVGAGHAYWCINGGEGQYFGLFTFDQEINEPKRAALAPLLGAYTPPPAEETAYPPTGWFVTLAPGLSATYLEETRSGHKGAVMHVSGQASAEGFVYVLLKSMAATPGQIIDFGAWAQVDREEANVTAIFAGISEYSSADVYFGGSGTDFHAARASLAQRGHQRTTGAGCAEVKGEIYTTIYSGMFVDWKIFLGDPSFYVE
jgi:endoglucanase